MDFFKRLQHGWNAFRNRDPTTTMQMYGDSYFRPDRRRFNRGGEKTLIASINNRIALDAASIKIQHCKVDDEGRFVSIVHSRFNDCLNLSANIDQTGRAFIFDVVLSMLNEGCIAIVPVETTLNPYVTGSYDILSMRTGKILEWFPEHIKVQVYNERTGKREDLICKKTAVAIVENPLYSVMNERNSTMQRLIKKLSLMDITDELVASGKIDLMVQVPYGLKTESKQKFAEQRRKDIETQLAESKYGIAYIDSTEKITQLNRPIETNLMSQVQYLTDQLFSQLCMTKGILDGTADDKTMLNYNNRIIEPIVSTVVDEMIRKFLTKTARAQKQTIMFFRDPFKLVPVNDIAEIADKFTRNEIMTSNEIRQVVGMKPSNDPKADELVNSNINQSKEESAKTPEEEVEIQNGNEFE